MEDVFVTRQAKQRASIKWLLSKYFNNRIPENLKEPFYRDHENQEHLKPQITGALANAEIYCFALGNIYSDPNYHNLNHWSILQTLTRKGVTINEPSDAQLTETTLIQTNPLKMSAHMAVIEAIMTLYAKEVVSPDRMQAAIQRLSHDKNITTPENYEKGIILWISHACEALHKKILQATTINTGEGDGLKPPSFPAIKGFEDLWDGVGLAALVSLYCPDEVPWTQIKVSSVPTVQDSLHNLRLLEDFCYNCLPVSIFHLNPEDLTYLTESLKLNVAVFLADLFNFLEIHPANCVRYSGNEKLTASRPMSAQLPLRKSSSLLQSTTDMSMSQDSLRRASEDSFVVHRGKNIPTLRQVISDEPLVPARLKSSKEKQNNDSKADERGEPPDKKTAAGRPSNWEDSRKNTFAGRRSRRNSVSDDSQLTIENFGGSQDNLNFIGRNPDKEMTVHVGRKISAPSFPVPIENKAIRSSIQDAKGSIQLGYDNGFEKQDYETEKFLLKRQLSCDNIALQKFNSSNSINKDLIKDLVDGEVINRISFADFNKKEVVEPRTVQLVYMQHEKEDTIKNNFSNNTGSSVSSRPESNTVPQTTWQQQSNNQQQLESNGGNDIEMSGNVSVQLNDIRLKLEEKRRHIESEKRKIEMTMNKQRQKVGKAAFLQAVSKEISDDASLLERKWNNQDNYNDVSKASHVDHLEAEQYHHSLAQMNTSLRDLQSDIQRLASQQHQIQAAQQQSLLVEQQKQILALQSNHAAVSYSPHEHPVTPPLHTYSPIPSNPPAYVPPPQFFLHDQPQNLVTPQRRTWAQQPNPPVPSENLWNSHSSPGFVLHNNPNDRFAPDQGGSRYNNGDSSRDAKSFTLSQHHYQNQNSHPYGTSHSTPSASPQHRNTYRQLTAPLDDIRSSPVSLHQISSSPPARISTVTHAPIPAPSADVMEPQNISFIGNSDEPLNQGIMKLNITSGSRTYRIPSPTRPLLIRGAFPSTLPNLDNNPTLVKESTPSETEQKGFYISFDNEQPKRPKPPLRTKRGSPRKERSFVENDDVGNFDAKRQEKQLAERKLLLERELAEERRKKEMEERIRKEEERVRERQVVANKFETSHEKPATSAIIIGNELSNPDPDLVDERERKKERIMLLSLQRRQQQEEAKQRKEQETQIRREREKAKEDEKIRKKEEQAARRTAILEQYKLKKAIEEAEKEGKVLDRSDLMSLKATPKPRPKAASRPRPKTIHIDSGSIEMSGGMLVASKNRKGSTSNLTDITDDRGMSPCSNSNQTLGRRSSYKTSRDTSPAQTRGRSKFSTYQNLKGRKSSSLMNLYGSSTDQDSFMYRFGDTDSGLGRATPPKRIPSPGMGSLRHLNSPSGPGSLPGFMSKGRRMFDDGSSDISSTPSSMMDYTGPRLYKQPATKSNRGIMLNAVEYCVFPGVVNREAKRRVLDEINRSESKHFLILFRDAGCQFRALYSYCPEGEEVIKLYGTGPKQVNERMFDRFFKYNSGGKCFSQIHTKHLTVTIDAFTIHNSLWQGKKVNLPSKKDMTLVI